MTETNSLKIRNPEESNLCSGLYLVPTPIGNLRDITLRSLDVLIACDILVCEDARVSGKLLKAYAIKNKKKIKYNDHADEKVKNEIVEAIANGKIVAMVSDAGTPLISDPGYKLVRACVENELYVTALPGANALLPALQLSCLPSDSFSFYGFLPSKDKALRDYFDLVRDSTDTTLFYESPKRLLKTLAVVDDIFGDRQISVSREISKLFEETYRGTAREIIDQIGSNTVKGEIVLVIEPCRDENKIFDVDGLILKALKAGERIKDLSQNIAEITGVKKKDIYNRALEIRE